MPELSIEELKAQLAASQAENTRLKAEVQEREAELAANIRLISAGESAAMTAHEALNPLTSVISRLQYFLDEETDGQLLKIIIEAWEDEFKAGGIEQLLTVLSAPIEGTETLMLEEDYHNLLKSTHEIYHDLEFILKQIKRVVLILNNLRGLSRTESTVIPYDVKNAVLMTVELMQDSLRKRQITLYQDYHHNGFVMVDENELVQVLHNLARNAMQAIERNGSITISTQQLADRLEIRIADSGPGIPPEIVPKLFEQRFTTKNKKEGTGLGLSFSRRMMQKYQGDLILESPGGKGQGGAIFLCWLPLPVKS